jgi:cholesterol oxidase
VQPDYQAVVIGSGFGGSVVACRLAQAGTPVCVLERGQAWPPGDFVRSPRDIGRKGFWDPSAGKYGMFNVWSFPGFGALVSSGLGGGSLIYANVLLRKHPDTFVRDGRETWPLGYADLEPHYDRVEPVLSGGPYPIEHEPYARTAKTHAMRAAAERLRARPEREGAEFLLPNLAIAFGNEGEAPRPGVELRGVPPSAHDEPHPRLSCLLTGECDLGCNYGSKNTLDLNFLGLAKQAGATIRTCCEVTGFAPLEDGYRVTFVDHSDAAAGDEPRGDLPEQTVTAGRLVLAAGTLGSTFLLLECRDAFERIDRGVLGSRFSSNGDLLSFLVKARQAEGEGPRVLEPSYGPVITSAIHVPKSDDLRGHYVEDAGYPYLVSWLAELATLPSIGRRAVRRGFRRALGRVVGWSVDTDLGAELADVIGKGVLSSSSMPLLSMGRDLPGGRFSLDDGRLTSDWSPDDSDDYFEEVEETLRGIADALGGSFRDSRVRGLTKLVTVHPLGGCPMGANEHEGVVDSFGQVFNYPGFFIVDGSVMPGSVGPNPSLTIAAIADRAAQRMLEAPPRA